MFFVQLSDKDKERSKDKKKSDKHRSSSSKLKDEANHDDGSYGVAEPEAVSKFEPMEEGECYDQDIPMHQEY